MAQSLFPTVTRCFMNRTQYPILSELLSSLDQDEVINLGVRLGIEEEELREKSRDPNSLLLEVIMIESLSPTIQYRNRLTRERLCTALRSREIGETTLAQSVEEAIEDFRLNIDSHCSQICQLLSGSLTREQIIRLGQQLGLDMSQDPDSILLLKVMIEKWLFPGNKCKKETLCKALREIGKEEIARAVENSPELEEYI